LLKESLACRGGTALNKVHLHQYVRYSEDIDFVQVRAEPIGPLVEALRGVMQPILGRAQWKQSEGRVTLVHKVTATEPSGQALRVKARDQLPRALQRARPARRILERAVELVQRRIRPA
jgi:hypothetical protein